jgi:hypothetical protein
VGYARDKIDNILRWRSERHESILSIEWTAGRTA